MASAADRRKAQRRLARQIATGTYRPSPVRQLYLKARERITGREVPGKMGDAGWKQSFHRTLGGALRKAVSLPGDVRAYILARGRSSGTSGEEGTITWLTVSPIAEPAWFAVQAHRDRIQEAIDQLFSRPPSMYSVMWQPV